MKKRIMTIALCLCLLAVAAMGTIAYFTDTDSAENVFALGNVDIKLVEQQRKYQDGQQVADSALEAFEDGKLLMPIVGSAQVGKDKNGLPTAKNYLDKIVNVENTGSESAYVRVLMAFPAAFDAESASDMMVHWNITDDCTWTIAEGEKNVTIGGQVYNIYTFTYDKELAAGKTTDTAALIGLYMDSRVDVTVDGDYVTYKLNDNNVTVHKNYKPEIKVFAQAVQAQGFATPAEALQAAALPTNPWA